MKQKLPTVKECLRDMEHSCNYKLIGKLGRACYILKDTTGNRPIHIREMRWSLNELRHAFKYGW